MNPYEEIRRLQEENAHLRAQLYAIEQEKQEIKIRERWEETLPNGDFHALKCYEIFKDIMENHGLPINGIGESYKIICDDNKIYYFMRGRIPESRVNYLMIQIDNGLIYQVKGMRIHSNGDIRINYGTNKYINLTLDMDTLIIGISDVINIERINRNVKMELDETRPIGWARHGYDEEYNYSLEGNSDIITIRQHYKKWLDADGNKIEEYFD